MAFWPVRIDSLPHPLLTHQNTQGVELFGFCCRSVCQDTLLLQCWNFSHRGPAISAAAWARPGSKVESCMVSFDFQFQVPKLSWNIIQVYRKYITNWHVVYHSKHWTLNDNCKMTGSCLQHLVSPVSCSACCRSLLGIFWGVAGGPSLDRFKLKGRKAESTEGCNE